MTHNTVFNLKQARVHSYPSFDGGDKDCGRGETEHNLSQVGIYTEDDVYIWFRDPPAVGRYEFILSKEDAKMFAKCLSEALE